MSGQKSQECRAWLDKDDIVLIMENGSIDGKKNELVFLVSRYRI
jgi:hypothetical protein